MLPIAASRYVGRWLGTDAPCEAVTLPASYGFGEESLSRGTVPKKDVVAGRHGGCANYSIWEHTFQLHEEPSESMRSGS
eukprot:2291485-Prymnesium_polylepis.1